MPRDTDIVRRPRRDEADDKLNQLRKEAQEGEARRLSAESGLGGTFTPPSDMTPEQRGKWESSLSGQEHLEEFIRTPKGIDPGPGMGQTAVEIGAGLTPAGIAIDVKDIGQAIQANDPVMAAMSGIGFLPLFGDAAKALFKAIRRGDRSAETITAAKKVMSEQDPADLLARLWDDPESLRSGLLETAASDKERLWKLSQRGLLTDQELAVALRESREGVDQLQQLAERSYRKKK